MAFYYRSSASETVGLKVSTNPCPFTTSAKRSRPCRGRLADFVLDWEDNLPDDDLDLADAHSCLADLSIVLGSTLQIVPVGNMPLQAKKYNENAKFVIVNLQPTKHDKKADLIIRDYVDDVMEALFKELGYGEIPPYSADEDPVQRAKVEPFVDWTQSSEEAKKFKKMADALDDEYKKRKRNQRKRKSSVKNENGVNKDEDVKSAIKDEFGSIGKIAFVDEDVKSVVKEEDVKSAILEEDVDVKSAVTEDNEDVKSAVNETDAEIALKEEDKDAQNGACKNDVEEGKSESAVKDEDDLIDAVDEDLTKSDSQL